MPHDLASLLKSPDPLPTGDQMIAKALDILNHSPHGQQLAGFAQKEGMTLKVIATPEPTAYLPQTRTGYIGFNRNHPLSPAAFVLTLAGLLREAQQEAAGIKHPPVTAPREEHLKTSMAKEEDKAWYMCTVACELNDQSAFSEYKFIEELGKMGYDDTMELYLKQERN